MKFCLSFLALLLVNANAFAPVGISPASRQSTARAFSPMDPSNLHEIPHHIQSLQDVMSTFSIADLDVDAAAAAQTAGEVAKTDNGWFGFLTGPTRGFLQLIHTGLNAVGLDSNSWGISIIVLTVTVKLLTFPLTKTQLESTQKMQLLQPEMKAVQAKYQSNPEVMNQKIAELYQTNDVNPLAGCLPTFAQIPVFIGLYRAVLALANENLLDEPFLWLPSLEGPIYGADPTKGASWLFDGWVNGAPSLGWEETAAFLVLPVVLVLSQFISMEIMTPKEQKESQPAFLKVLPLMIGYFSLSVPSALSVYWVTNNFITTATSMIIRNGMKIEPATVGATIDTTAEIQSNVSAFTPPPIREKPEGFGGSSSSMGGVTPITSTDEVIDADVVSEVSVAEPMGAGDGLAPTTKKKRGKKRKKKRK